MTSAGAGVIETSLRLRGPLDLARTLAPLGRAPAARTMILRSNDAWRATVTPEGPATLHLRSVGGELLVESWGPGAAWAVAGVPDLVGEFDRTEEFRPQHPLLADLHRRHLGVRATRSRAVFELLVPVVIEQKVIGLEARRAYASLVRAQGEPAPGPAPLRLPPSPQRLAAMPYWEFHPLGIERKRAETVIRVARAARRLEEAAAMEPPAAHRRLTAVPGVGPWTAGHVAGAALGDLDAVPVGDYHLPGLVCWALAGESPGTDERMLELLEPYAGRRGRVLRLLLAGGPMPARRGPRLPLRNLHLS